LSPRQEELLSNVLQEAAQAIAGELLHRAQQEEAWVNTALLQVAEAVNSLIDLDEILGTIVRFVPLLIGVEKSIILIWDESTRTYHSGPSHGLSEMGRGLLESFEISAEEFPSIQLTEEGRPSAFPYQVIQLPGWLRTVLEKDSGYLFPLYARASLVGALLVTPPSEELPLTGRRLSILTGIGQQAAIAVVNDQLYEEAAERSRLEQELDVARSIQASFIPPGNPAFPGCSVASYWRAARQVGGDFYDFYNLGRNHWGVLVADVADKGVPAALFMALCRTVLRTIALQRENPARTLERANQIIWNDTTSDLFVTVFYAVWNPDEEVLTYANAGHNPPVLLRAGRPPIMLSGAGMALGVLEQIEVEARRVHFRPSDVLLCYTDGVTEAINEDRDEFGVERLMVGARVANSRGAEDIIAEITAAIREFSGDTPQSDDITIVVVKREDEQEGQG
jgi:serine phosphatase RsbU (regulator of sigma subunit)